MTMLVCSGRRMERFLFVFALHLFWITESGNHPVPVFRSNCEDFLVSGHGEGGVSKRTVLNANLFGNKFNWPDGIIAYKFHPNLHSEVILSLVSAMSGWAENTCLRFQEADDDDVTYVLLKEGKKCSAQIGYHPGITVVSISKGCDHSSLLHELGHVIGFVHEHSRFDRDNYITILWENISPGAEVNFCRFPRNTIDSLGHDYDYASIMHYSSRAFSRNGKRTIKPVKPGITFGASPQLSAVDIQKANQMYNCSKADSGGQSILSLSTGSKVALLLAGTNQTWVSCRSTYLGCVTSECLGVLGSRLNTTGCPSEVYTLVYIGKNRVGFLSIKRGHLVSCTGPRCTLIRCPELAYISCRNHSFYFSFDNDSTSSNIKPQLSNNSVVTLLHPTNHELAMDCTTKRCRLTNICIASPSDVSSTDSSGMNCQEVDNAHKFQIVAL